MLSSLTIFEINNHFYAYHLIHSNATTVFILVDNTFKEWNSSALS